jgi:CCR4-NOT transcription complex subunit 1
MLIEKAATEKAVRDVDESLAQAMNARRKHREQTGQPFYDMSIFGNPNQRYPGALPEQLRPKPGGLRSEHFQLYDSFQRLPRQPPAPGAMGTAGAPVAGVAPGRAPGAPVNGSGEAEPAAGQKTSSGQQLGIEALSALAAKLDSAVTNLLSVAGPRAPEIKLPMLPPEHQIRQILAAVKQVMPNVNPGGGISRTLNPTEQEAVLGFSQSIFKRLYELSLTEPLRLEALVALLERVNVSCPKLGKDIGTWATYAPTNTEAQRRLHRTVLLLLIRSRLLAVNELDGFLAARADNGRNHIWVEFSLLFIRTAFMERISSPSDFPKLMELMSAIAEGRSQASPQLVQTYRKPILRMLEETRGLSSTGEQQPTTQTGPGAAADPRKAGATLQQSSSLSVTSLSKLSQASRKVAESTEAFSRSDPPNSRQQVTSLLDSWIRVHNEAAGNDKVLAQYLQILQQFGVGKVEEHTERFFRLSALVVVEAVQKTASTAPDGSRTPMNYNVIDIYCKLLLLMFRHLNAGGTADQVKAQRLSMLNKILGVIVRTMMWDAEKSKKGTPDATNWDQRPWFRLFVNLVIDMNKPDEAFAPIRLGILSVFGAAFHVCQPLVMPGMYF